jgi:hypothetical protein
LAYHGDFLAQRNPDLVTDIDCLLLAGAFSSFGDYDRAERYHALAVEKSVNNVVRMNNLRALARFWFSRGNAERGRSIYQESIQLDKPDTDSIRQIVADTYLIWARLEQENGYEVESNRIKGLAVAAAKRIGNTSMRDDMLAQLESSFPAKA